MAPARAVLVASSDQLLLDYFQGMPSPISLPIGTLVREGVINNGSIGLAGSALIVLAANLSSAAPRLLGEEVSA